MWIDKAETWALADELGVLDVIRHETLTCYNGIPGDGCGHCPACTLRREGLEKYLKSKNQYYLYIEIKMHFLLSHPAVTRKFLFIKRP